MANTQAHSTTLLCLPPPPLPLLLLHGGGFCNSGKTTSSFKCDTDKVVFEQFAQVPPCRRRRVTATPTRSSSNKVLSRVFVGLLRHRQGRIRTNCSSSTASLSSGYRIVVVVKPCFSCLLHQKQGTVLLEIGDCVEEDDEGSEKGRGSNILAGMRAMEVGGACALAYGMVREW